MGIIIDNTCGGCLISNTASLNKRYDIIVEPTNNSLIKLQSHIRGYLYRKNNNNVLSGKVHFSQSSNNNLSTNPDIKEVGLSYSTEVQECHMIIKKLKKLIPDFELNEKEKFNLSIEQNLKRNGFLYPDDSIYKGTVNSKLLKEGFGKLFLRDGSIYTGFFKDDKIEGRGLLLNVKGFVYEGDFINSQANGYGKYITLDGIVYKGGWKNDKQCGYGEESYPDGSKYQGEFYEGKKHGKGVYMFPGGYHQLTGMFNKGELEGEGELRFKDGRVYYGHFKNNKMNGWGMFMWPDYKKFLGQYKDGVKCGYGMFTWEDEEKNYEGFWADGKQNGYGIMRQKNKEEYGEFYQGNLIKVIDKQEQIHDINLLLKKVLNTNDYINFMTNLNRYTKETNNNDIKGN